MFSQDSQELLIVTPGNVLAHARVSDGSKLESKELAEHSCLQLEIAPGGVAVACVTTTLGLTLRDTTSGDLLYSGNLHETEGRFGFPVPIGIDSAFSSPFGFVMLDSFAPLANRRRRLLGLAFSPDAGTLLVGRWNGGFRIDLPTREKSSLAGNVQKHLRENAVFLDADRLLSLEREHQNQAVVVSATSGAVLTSPSFKSDRLSLAANSKYALLYRADSPGAALFDLQADRPIAVPANLGLDVYHNELAVLDENGDLYIYRLGETQPVAVTHLPVDRLAPPSSAAVNSDSSRFVVSVSGVGALFENSTGRRIWSGWPFSAAAFGAPGSLFLLLPERPNHPREVTRQDLKGSSGTLAWSSAETAPLSIHPGRAALLEYFPESLMGRGLVIGFHGTVPFRLTPMVPELREGSAAPFLRSAG